jgi:hypothetical protein
MARRVDDDPRIALDVQNFFHAAPSSTPVPTAAAPRRWIPLNALDPAGYFTVPK